MTSRQVSLPWLALAGSLLVSGPACERPQAGGLVAGSGRSPAPAGVSSLPPDSPEVAAATAAGQTIFVPAYSAVATADNSLLYPLAITLSIRNIDRRHPIIVTAVGYRHQDGGAVRDLLKTPLRIAPLAATQFFVRESDSTGGNASSFLVDWSAADAVTSPIVESLMVGTTGNQGISFTCPGRVIADRVN
jgi:hypothetical protein